MGWDDVQGIKEKTDKMSEKRQKTRNGHAIRIPGLRCRKPSRLKHHQKAESSEELKPDNRK